MKAVATSHFTDREIERHGDFGEKRQKKNQMRYLSSRICVYWSPDTTKMKINEITHKSMQHQT